MNRARVVTTLAVGVLIFNGGAVPVEAAVTCFGRQATILGTDSGPGGDRLRGTPYADVIVARGGNDGIWAAAAMTGYAPEGDTT
jgi:hypothetical protein